MRCAVPTLPSLSDMRSRLPFLMAVALLAAAIGDPLVETIANSGVLGPGFADYDHSSVIPALIVGTSLALLLIGWECRRLVRSRSEARERPIGLARRFLARSPIHDMPFVVILQLGVVFVMESGEQLFSGGGLVGGTAWLGGPVVFSLLAHACIGAICTLLVAHGMRAIVRRCATLVEVVFDRILGAFGPETATIFARRDDEVPRCTQMLHVHRCGERAPPRLLILT